MYFNKIILDKMNRLQISFFNDLKRGLSGIIEKITSENFTHINHIEKAEVPRNTMAWWYPSR